MDKYPLVTGSLFSIEEYCISLSNIETLQSGRQNNVGKQGSQSMSQSHEFSVDEYNPNVESTSARNVYQSSTSVSSGRQTNVGKQGPQSMSQSNAFSVDEYDPNEESTSARNVYQSSTSVSSSRQTNVGKQGSQSMSLSDAYTYIQLFASIFVNFFMCTWF